MRSQHHVGEVAPAVKVRLVEQGDMPARRPFNRAVETFAAEVHLRPVAVGVVLVDMAIGQMPLAHPRFAVGKQFVEVGLRLLDGSPDADVAVEHLAHADRVDGHDGRAA